MKELLYKSLPVITADIKEKLEQPRITQTLFEDRETVLCNDVLQQEIGYGQFADGSWLVSMTCPMPGITPEMIEWWFWWHCQDNLRYRIWFPGEHISIRYRKKDRDYFRQPSMPHFKKNSQCPVERIGGVCMPLQIDFVQPEEFGFSRQIMEEESIPVIICGHVSAFYGLVYHTEMAHIFKKEKDGLFLISRFWMGETLKSSFIRKRMLTEKSARSMAEHCCIEYRNLAEIFPELYQRYGVHNECQKTTLDSAW